MIPKPVTKCTVCHERIRWGGRLLRTLHKHDGRSTCIHRDRWHCAGCCFRVARNEGEVALEKALIEALS